VTEDIWRISKTNHSHTAAV